MSKIGILKWTLTTILVIVGVIILIRLGIWQLDRLQARRQFNAHYQEQTSSPIIHLNDYVNVQELVEMDYRKVDVSGYYDFKNEIYLQNHAWNNLPGYRVVTPLIIDDTDKVAFVERGWIALDDLNNIDSINKNYGQHQDISGIIRLPQSKNDFGGGSNHTNSTQSNFYLYVDLDYLSTELEYDLLPIYIQLNTQTIDQKPYSQLSEIEITEGPHMGYAIQWFFFAGLLGFGYPFFVRNQISRDNFRSRE